MDLAQVNVVEPVQGTVEGLAQETVEGLAQVNVEDLAQGTQPDVSFAHIPPYISKFVLVGNLLCKI